MVELDGAVEVTGVDGSVPFRDLFQGRDQLVVYHSMWYDGAPHQGQCEGCTFNVWHMKDVIYLNARGVSFAVLTSGPWDEVADFVEFMGYTQPWYSVRGVEGPPWQKRVTSSVTCATATAVPHVLHDRPGQRAGPRVLGPARHDALRPSGGVGGQPRRLARRPSGRRAAEGTAHRSAGTGAQTLTASPPGARPAGPCRNGPAPAGDPGGDPRPPRRPPLTRIPSGWT